MESPILTKIQGLDKIPEPFIIIVHAVGLASVRATIYAGAVMAKFDPQYTYMIASPSLYGNCGGCEKFRIISRLSVEYTDAGYRQTSSISGGTKYPKINVSRIVLQLPLPKPLKAEGIKIRMKL